MFRGAPKIIRKSLFIRLSRFRGVFSYPVVFFFKFNSEKCRFSKKLTLINARIILIKLLKSAIIDMCEKDKQWRFIYGFGVNTTY